MGFMKYEVYIEYDSREIDPCPIGWVFQTGEPNSSFSFWIPCRSRLFREEGIDWEKDGTLFRKELTETKFKTYIFVKHFYSVKSIKQWIYENYFEWFL